VREIDGGGREVVMGERDGGGDGSGVGEMKEMGEMREEKILGEIGFDFLVYEIRTRGSEKILGNF
jgi:hypothetical protein